MTAALHRALMALGGQGARPSKPDLVADLLQLEKAGRQDKTTYRYEQLVGTWQLGFITGTLRSQQQTRGLFKSGIWLPSWLQIRICYEPGEQADRGQVVNQVGLGPCRLTVNGPVRFWSPRNILAFDFTELSLGVAGRQLYQGDLRGGRDDAAFYEKDLKTQPFFAYFWISEDGIAARGRGGGLALWRRVPEAD